MGIDLDGRRHSASHEQKIHFCYVRKRIQDGEERNGACVVICRDWSAELREARVVRRVGRAGCVITGQGGSAV